MQYNILSNSGDIMTNEDIVDMVEDVLDNSVKTTKECLDNSLETTRNVLDESLKATNEVIQEYSKVNNQIMEQYIDLIDEHANVIIEYISFVSSDIVESYKKMIELRKECIDKYINFYSLLFRKEQDIDISKPIKSLLKNQQEDIERWNQELMPLLELAKINENTSDEKANEVLDMFKNI